MLLVIGQLLNTFFQLSISFEVNLPVHSDSFNQPSFEQRTKVIGNLVDFSFGKISSTSESETFIKFELIETFLTTNFTQVLLNFDILVTLQQIIYLLHYLCRILSVSQQETLNHRH